MANFSQIGLNSSAFNYSVTPVFADPFQILRTLYMVGYFEGYALGALSFVANLAVLLTFCFHQALISPFTIHVLITTAINILVLVIYIPMTSARTFRPSWFLVHNNCAAYLYLQSLLLSMVVLQHFVVCVDRWLAILVPHWYRRKRSVKTGLIQTGISLAYFHIWFLPQFFLHLRDLYRTPLGSFCDNWKQTTYSVVVTLATGLLPEVIMYISYPVLLLVIWKRRQRRFHGSVGVGPKGVTNGDTLDPDSHDAESGTAGHAGKRNPLSGTRGSNQADARIVKHERSSRFRDGGQGHRSSRITSGAAEAEVSPNKEAPGVHGKRQPKINRNTRLVLALLLVQIVLWTPVTVTSILVFTHNPPKYTYEATLVARNLSLLLFLIDPLFFFIFLPSLRKAALNSLRQLSGRLEKMFP